MSAADDVARMLTLVPWLIERPGASVTETAAAFGVSERVIREDLSHLDFCGLPGLGGRDLFEVDLVGDRIVVSMADELRRPLRLNPREALRLVLTVDAVADALGDELPALRSAVDKVRVAAGVPAGVSVHLDTEAREVLTPIRHALAAGRQVEFTYRGRGDREPRRRRVDPWALHVRDGAWYVQGHDHGADDRRTFRADRMGAVSVLDRPIEVLRPDGPLPPPRYAAGPDDVEVVLLLDPSGRWLVDAIDPVGVAVRDDGRTQVTFSTDELGWIERLVLMAAGSVEVVAPPELRTQVHEVARAALRRYRR